MDFLERHDLRETCAGKLADYGVESMGELKSLKIDDLKGDVHLKPMHAKRLIDALAADAKKAGAEADARAKARVKVEQQEAEARRQRELEAEAARQRKADADARAKAQAQAQAKK